MPPIDNVPEFCLRAVCGKRLIKATRGAPIPARDIPEGHAVHAGRGLCHGCHQHLRLYRDPEGLAAYPRLTRSHKPKTKPNHRRKPKPKPPPVVVPEPVWNPTRWWSFPDLFDPCQMDEGEEECHST